MTLSAEIFGLTAPYDNPYQSDRERVLYVCSAGMLRSPSAAAIAGNYGQNARSCGSSWYALIPLSNNLITWANRIIFMDQYCYETARSTFALQDCLVDMESKAEIWDLKDIYPAFDPKLEQLIKDKLNAKL